MSAARKAHSATARPTAKVEAGALTGAAVLILVWILGLLDVDVPAETAAGLTTVLTGVAAYLTPPRLRDLAFVPSAQDTEED